MPYSGTLWSRYISSCYRPVSERRRRHTHPARSPKPSAPPTSPDASVYDLWAASRVTADASHSPDAPDALAASDCRVPGSHRPVDAPHLALALQLLRLCGPKLLCILWPLHPWRSVLMIVLNLVRGLFPASREFSQAALVNELQDVLIAGTHTWSAVFKLLLAEGLRLAFESVLDSVASANEDVVHNSAQYAMEFRQLQLRLRLDIPTRADPAVDYLLRESDLFVRSFTGTSTFGLFSVLDFTRIIALASELLAYIMVLYSLVSTGIPVWMLLASALACSLPQVLACMKGSSSPPEDHVDVQERRAVRLQEKMRSLAESERYRPEVILFGLGPWILRSWARARRTVLQLDKQRAKNHPAWTSAMLPSFSTADVSSLLYAAQNLPLLLAFQSSSPSLGSFILCRSTVQSLIWTASSLAHALQMAYQGVFLMGAFTAAMELQPRLSPAPDDAERMPHASRDGMKLEIQNLSFTYPGRDRPTLTNVNLTVEPGEVVAIVGYNGSGKTTLANVLLRLQDFDAGALRVDGACARRLRPAEYHRRVAAVLQDFARYPASVQENVGFGCVADMHDPAALADALGRAQLRSALAALPRGLRTVLDVVGDARDPHVLPGASHAPRGLSGGQWQRIAIARALMRARRPEVGLLVLDEPTSSLDAQAAKDVLDSIRELCNPKSGERRKTVVIITHRLSVARRADKIALMVDGSVAEFGTHEELVERDGDYASLYKASI